MKNTIIKYTAAALAVLMLASCERFLEENPPVDFSAKAAFATEAGCEAGIVGCYSALLGGALWQADMIDYISIASGFFHWRGYRGGNQYYEPLLQQAMAPNYPQRHLLQFYSAINRCNILLENLAQSPVNKAYKEEVEGEAYLIRAMLYFYLVRLHGSVPLVTKSPTSVAQAEVGLTPTNEIYRQIIDDLNKAWGMMRDEARQSQVTGTTGRPNKWAAKAFLAKVYVQIGSIMSYPDDQHVSFTNQDFGICDINSAKHAWELALSTAEDVIENGPYRLADKFTDLFRWTDPADFQLKERIFVLQSTENGNPTARYAAQRSLPQYIFGSAQNAPSAAVNDNYGRFRPTRYIYQTWAGAHGGIKPASARADGFDDIYVGSKDPRFDATFYHNSYQYYNGGSKDKISTMNIYPGDKLTANVSRTAAAPITNSPYLKKYLDPKYNGTRGYADFYMLRFADMYLLAAEAAAELSNGTGDAMWNKAFSHVETIHARARRTASPESEFPKWAAGQFASKQELLDAVFYERIYEFLGEGQEWYDVRRKGAGFMIRNLNKPLNAFNTLPTEGRDPLEPFGDGYFATAYLGYVFPESVEALRNRLVCALSNEFINTNPAINPNDPKVNPGW